MNSNISTVKLIIKNIQSLEQAQALLSGEISEKTFKKLDEIIENHIKIFEGEWSGEYNFHEKETSWFAPCNWKLKESIENYYASYWLDCKSSETGEDGSYWWLSHFLKNDRDHMIFTFSLNNKNFSKLSIKDLKIFSNNQNQQYQEIEKAGFKYNASKGRWYVIVENIDPEFFVESYESDTLEDALKPFIDALDKLKQAHPYFDKIVQMAIKEFGTE